MTKHLLALAAVAGMAMTANAAEISLNINDLGNGWGGSYDAATQTITFPSAWSGCSWWLSNADYSDYDEVVVTVETDIDMQLVIQYAGDVNENFSIDNGVMTGVLNKELKNDVVQIAIQSKAEGTAKVISAVVRNSAPLGDSKVLFEGSHANLDPDGWYPGLLINADKFIYATAGSKVVVDTEFEGDGYSYKFCAGWSAVLLPSMTSIEGFQDQWSTVWTNQNSFSITLTQEDLDIIANEGGTRMGICGANYTITKVTLFYNNAESAVEAVAPVSVEDVYYNLQGIRVANPTKGLYIHNGKKVIL